MNPHPYSPAFNAAGFGFVSGALSVDEHGVAVEGVSQSFDAAIARLAERLATIQMSLDDVVKTTYFVTDVSSRDAANRHYESIFPEPRPARSFVEVSGLPYGATVEIEAIAYKNPQSTQPERGWGSSTGKETALSTKTQARTELEQLIDSCIATAQSRYEDWDTLAFQADKGGDRFKRAQIRYLGSGATGNHEGDSRTIPADHFTLSNMRLPVGAVGPEHTHHDVEEVFFVLEGTLEVSVHDVEDGNKKATRVLGYRDLVRVPAGVPRSLRNAGDVDALFCVIIGAPKPQLPTYPPSSEMHGVTR